MSKTVTVTEPGTVNTPTLLDRFTTRALPAACVSATVHCELALLPREPGEQFSEFNCAPAAESVMLAVRVCPFRLAVTVATSLATMLEAVTENVAVLCPAATDTLAGTGKAALLLASPTTVARLAVRFREIVQMAD